MAQLFAQYHDSSDRVVDNFLGQNVFSSTIAKALQYLSFVKYVKILAPIDIWAMCSAQYLSAFLHQLLHIRLE